VEFVVEHKSLSSISSTEKIKESAGSFSQKYPKGAGHWWVTPIIPATWEAEIGA
jgi:hypothetical protein